MSSARMITSQDAKPKRAWQRMLSGRRLDLLNPDPADIEIEDIAHGLARVARWNGQTVGAHAFSVAQHSLLVEQFADSPDTAWSNQWRLAALLHDGAEYVVGDLISPFKAAIGFDYKSFENKLMDAIYRRFGVPSPLPAGVAARIKNADRISAYFEATHLAGFTQPEAEQFFGKPSGLAATGSHTSLALEPWPTERAQRALLDRYRGLIV